MKLESTDPRSAVLPTATKYLRAHIALPLAFATLLGTAIPCLADEGMWEIDGIDNSLMARMRDAGLELDRDHLYNGEGGGLARAIIDLGQGTGSFVSSAGLILTNYHVVYQALQEISVGGRDLIEKGFAARDRAAEIPVPGLSAAVLIAVKDVTQEVLDSVTDQLSDLERHQVIRRRQREIVEAAEQASQLKCRLVEVFGGRSYKLYYFFKALDVRIVFAPPRSIGLYGGDADNFSWPRHSGDFCFLRAYVGADGLPGVHSDSNVPYQPAVYLPVSATGVRDGAFTMIPGFPIRTMRYRSTYSLSYYQDFLYPRSIEYLGALLEILERAASQDDDKAMRVTTLELRYGNVLKYYQGLLDGFRRSQIREQRETSEQDLMVWLEADAEMGRRYGDVLPRIERLYEGIRSWREKRHLLRSMQRYCLLLEAASLIVGWGEEKVKPDDERGQGFRERDLDHLRGHLRMVDTGFVDDVDRSVLRYFLEQSRMLPEEQRIAALDGRVDAAPGDTEKARIDNVVRDLFDATSLADPARREELFGMGSSELHRQGDPLLEFARELRQEMKEIDGENEKFNSSIGRLRPLLVEAYQEWRGPAMYPDANGTLRIAFGQVRGYSPRDAVRYGSQTSLKGVLEKATGKKPFDCPERLRQLHQGGDFVPYGDPDLRDLPVNFLSDDDTRAGNSGSPVLNGRGEVVGVTFDGNYESMAADYEYDARLTRTINVDIRYVLFILDRFSNAQGILKELRRQ